MPGRFPSRTATDDDSDKNGLAVTVLILGIGLVAGGATAPNQIARNSNQALSTIILGAAFILAALITFMYTHFRQEAQVAPQRQRIVNA